MKQTCEYCGCNLETDEITKHPGYCKTCNELKELDNLDIFNEEGVEFYTFKPLK